ncbi:MAG: ATP-binding cassette domain-containing protein [Paracoccaceae bacterium]
MNLSLRQSPVVTAGPATPPPDSWFDMRDLVYRPGASFDLVIPRLALARGRKTALVGGNGSGKTTLLRLLLGDLVPGSGTATPVGAAAGLFTVAGRQDLGLQLQDSGFSPSYRVRDILAINAACRRATDPVVLELMGVAEIAARRWGDLSSGQKQRVQLALALAHHPRFAIFDEPTSNLDPVYASAFVELLDGHARRDPGFTALFISHSAEVVESCDDILILAAGRVETHAPLAEVIATRFGPRAARFEGRADTLAVIAAALPAGVRPRLVAGGLLVHGPERLAADALDLARRHAPDLTRFATWATSAADILEDLKNDN